MTIDLLWKARWNFFAGGISSKTGYVSDLGTSGCTLKTDEPIEFRRWIRMMIKDPVSQVSYAAVGRVIRCESSFEAERGSDVTLYRYQVEFTFPVALACARAATLVAQTAKTQQEVTAIAS